MELTYYSCSVGPRHMIPGLAIGTAAFVAYSVIEFAVNTVSPASSGHHAEHAHGTNKH